MVSTTSTKQTPLEMLVVSQLAAIRRSEAQLQERLVANPALEASHFASEVRKLQSSADRLGRMIDAMNLNTFSNQTILGSQVAA